jgi:uncharacterized SAM-binding protein YcdF (DUF218 family)
VRRGRRGCGVFTAGLLLVAALAFLELAVHAGSFLVVNDSTQHADAIVSLGGDTGGFPRVHHAVALFEQGYAPVVVLSGGTLAGAGLKCSSAQLSLEAAQELGLAADATIIALEAQSTYDEARNLSLLARQHGWHSLIVVTNAFHSRRADRTFRTLIPGVAISVSVAPDARYDPGHWWRNEYSVTAVIDELIKLGFYWVQYGIAPI